MLISSQNSLTESYGIPLIIFLGTMAQPCWYVKLTITKGIYIYSHGCSIPIILFSVELHSFMNSLKITYWVPTLCQALEIHKWARKTVLLTSWNFLVKQGLANYDPWANLSHSPFLGVKIFWNTTMFIFLWVVYDCLHATMAPLSHYYRDNMPCKL